MILTRIWAMMLNNRAKKDSEKVLDSLEIKQGDVIADIGSGGGYFAARLAKRAGKDGKMFVADTNKALLLYVAKAMKKQHIYNVKTIVGREDGCPLPKESCDLIFMRNVFHYLTNSVSYFRNIRESLKPGGRIAIVEWLPNMKGNYVSCAGYCTSEKEIRGRLCKAGFAQLKSFDFLNGQSFNIFKKDAKEN